MTKKKSSYHHGNLRQAVLEAAHQLMESEGVGAITLRRIAKEVGVSQNAPYSHFKDKAALLDALATDGFHNLINRMRNISTSATTPSNYLQAIGKAYVHYALSNPVLFHLMFNAQQTDKPMSDELQQASSQSFQILRDAVANFQESKNKDGEGELIATLSAWAIVHGLSVLLTENKLSNNPEFKKLKNDQIIEQATTIFTQGLLNPR